MKVFLDANILISASVPESLCAGFIKVLARKSEISSSIYCIKEAEKNLSKIKSSSRAEFDALVEMLVISPEAVLPNLNVAIAEKDLPVLAAALAGGCSPLLTGDLKHFGFLMGKKFKGIEVLSTTMMAHQLQQQVDL